MRFHYLQHVPFEGLAYIEKWLQVHSLTPSMTPLYQNHDLPNLNDFDCLIIMGGPMGVHDENNFTWMKAEKKFIEGAIKNGKIVVGICLGAQLISDVLGAKVYRNSHKEIGWFPVQKIRTSANTIFDSLWPNEFYAFHWHGDTFDIPYGAIHFAETAACKNQGFVFQDKIFGFQFHLESTQDSIEQLIAHCGDELNKEKYIQNADEIRNNASCVSISNQRMHVFLNKLLGH